MSQHKYQKLELTWIGKGDEPKLEPRILIENPAYSYGDPHSPNMLIHGDNLLALKALEQDFANQVKCIYIDPPFNTGAAFEHYDDGIEHSIWLDLMQRRLKLLHQLLKKDGSIFVHLDDNESDYCKILMDEIFGRTNFINKITIEARSPSAFSTVNPGVFKSSEYLLWYAKDKRSWESRSMRIPSQRDSAYNKFIINRNDDCHLWKMCSLKQAFLEYCNGDKIQVLKNFIQDVFSKRDTLSDKNTLLKYLNQFFPFDQLIDSKILCGYLLPKIRLENTYSNFFSKVYIYLLEKTSNNFNERDLDFFVFTNAESVFRETEISDSGAGKETVDLKYLSMDNPGVVHRLERTSGLDDVYIIDGKQISFYSKNVVEIDQKLTATKLLTNIWTDISWEGIAKEGGVTFKKGKKPEKLIQRCLLLATNEGDIVFDSFLGSGTTAAVAHKMGRQWIGVELGDHVFSHCHKRLKAVVDGEQGGISKAVGWQGGGGFRFYTLAPSLLNKDAYGNWVISIEYNAQMLAAAMAKQEGFRFHPHPVLYWKQGQSSEQDYIFTTTQFVTVEAIDRIAEQMQPGESLLVCCKAFQQEAAGRHPGISIKKIPHILLGRCEFGREDYSLHIVNLPEEERESAASGNDAPAPDTRSVQEIGRQGKRDKGGDAQPTLFDD